MALKLDPARESWMSATETRAVLAALQHDGSEARFVGGAVRNAVLGHEISDIDIATPLVPSEVMRRLETAGIKAVATGADHGTVTAIVGVRSFEVTTLRRDVVTDGRHAIVQFSTDWKEDAARRDFTMNALYASAEGEIFDYFGGAADAKTGRVRFIGDASQRIREDHLRILRLFRFHAWYGKGEIDADALVATAAAKAGIANLSGERLRSEMLKLLAADRPEAVLRIMAAASILSEILPGPLMIPRLERLASIDAEAFFAPDALLRLAALLPSDPSRVAAVAARWQLSNAECRRLEEIGEIQARVVSYLSVREVHKLLYRLGDRRFKDIVFLRWAEDPRPSGGIGWRALLAQADSWQRPKFPLTGRDVILAGVPEGPLVGEILGEVEEWWADADFTDDAFSLAERLKAVVQGKGL